VEHYSYSDVEKGDDKLAVMTNRCFPLHGLESFAPLDGGVRRQVLLLQCGQRSGNESGFTPVFLLPSTGKFYMKDF
jgi:hypothetical protein